MRGKTSVLSLLFLVGASIVTSGYVVNSQRHSATNFHPFWQTDSPLRFVLSNSVNDSLDVIEKGTDASLVIRTALESWAQVSSLTIVMEESDDREVGTVTGRDGKTLSAGSDGVNLITLPARETPDEDLIPEGVLAVTWSRFLISENGFGTFSEADILFSNRFLFSNLDTDDASESRDVHNLFDVALHEVGHALNLAHSPALHATMFPRGGDFDFAFNRLSWDDVAGINSTPAYRLPGLSHITGRIEGRILLEGEPVFGASVSAIDESGIAIAGAVTSPDGSFTIENLPPSRYFLYVEPLDGPMTVADLSGGIFSDSPLNSVFLPRILDDGSRPLHVVEPQQPVFVGDLAVSAGEPAIQPVLLGKVKDVEEAFIVRQSPVDAFIGQGVNLGIVGNGLERVTGSDFSLLGRPDLQASRVSSRLPAVGQLPLSIYSLAGLPGEMARGPHTLLLRHDSETRALPGALNVFFPFQFERFFAQFVHLAGAANSRVILLNTTLASDQDKSVNSAAQVSLLPREGGEQNNGGKVSLPLESVESGLDGELLLPVSPGGLFEGTTQGTRDFVGSLRVRADQPVEAALLLETRSGTTGVGSSKGVYSFVAPIVMREQNRGGEDTGVAVTNVEDLPVQMYFRLLDQDGKMQAETVRSLPANGHLALFPKDLFLDPAIPSGSFDGTLLVTANRRIAATIIRTTPGVFTTFPVILSHSRNRTIFAQFAHIPGALSSELILVNPSPTLRADSAVVQIRDSNGNAAPVSLNNEFHEDGRREVSLPPLGMIRLETTGDQIRLAGGSVEVTSNVPLGGVVIFGSADVGNAAVAENIPLRKGVVPVSQDQNNGKIRTGVALLNPSDEGIKVKLELRDQNGRKVIGGQLFLRGWEQRSLFVDELRKEGLLDSPVPESFLGSLWLQAVESDRFFAATVIRQSPGVLTTLPIFSLDRVNRR